MECRVFIVHADEDGAFVRDYLVPALDVPAQDVALSSALSPGSFIVDEIARGVSSAVVLLILSPAFVASAWTEYAQQLAIQRLVESGTGRVIPLLRVSCELPLQISSISALDFRDPARWAEEAARLHKALQTPARKPGRARATGRRSAEQVVTNADQPGTSDSVLGWLRERQDWWLCIVALVILLIYAARTSS